MIDIKNPADCCGCTACASICAHDAITMKPDALGFLYPEVDKSKCVECGLCEKVCAFNDQYDKSDNVAPATFAGRNKNIEELRESRSGAVFIAFSNYILDNGGVVYGAGYTDHFRVVHKRATTKEERNEFKGSKYVQSDLTGIFKMVKDDLKAGRMVLLSGSESELNLLEVEISQVLQPNLIHPTPANPLRQKFEDDYKNKGYLYVLTRYGNVGWRYKMKTLKDKITRKLSLR